MAKKPTQTNLPLTANTLEEMAKGYTYPKAKKDKNLFLKISLVLLIFVFGLVVLTTASITANVADYVLRPTIGSERTLELESVFFNLEDKFNQFKYKVIPPQEKLSYTVENQSPPKNLKKEMSLDSIPLNNFGFTPLEDEGVWIPMPLKLLPDKTVMARTFVRTDPERPYAIVTLVKIDMKEFRLDAVAGSREPGAAEGNPGPGKIPPQIQQSNNLVAAFNGGFQERDGHYGMVVRNKTYLPLLMGLATLIIDKNSNLKIIDYEGQDLGKDNLVIRQNGGMLVENSQVIPSLANQQYGLWGRTVTNSMYTWRSGIGITKDGNLIYAVGPSLIPATLGEALKEAGAINAMQLDINPYWVRFVLFNPLGKGKYTHVSLLKDMYDGGEDYLRGYQKDFFYLYKK